MATRTYPHGVPCWIDTEQPDQEEACRFYGGLFGWTLTDAMPPDAPGHYFIATLDGHDVAAIGSPDEASSAVWNTYIAVDDADAAAAEAARRGGTVITPPADVGPAGRGADLADPDGARFSIWQAGRRPGAQLANVPGAWNFSDLHTTDGDTARRFYGALFGWVADDPDVADVGPRVSMWRRPGYGDHLAATVDPGIHERQAAVHAPPGFADAIGWMLPVEPDEAPCWHVTFAVADRDAAVAAALGLGAADLSGPVDTAWTRAAVVADPQDAVFTLSQFTPPG